MNGTSQLQMSEGKVRVVLFFDEIVYLIIYTTNLNELTSAVAIVNEEVKFIGDLYYKYHYQSKGTHYYIHAKTETTTIGVNGQKNRARREKTMSSDHLSVAHILTVDQMITTGKWVLRLLKTIREQTLGC
jgi:hypothetical protein